MKLKFVTYSTPDYAERAIRFDATMGKFDLDYSRSKIEDQGGWKANVLYRASFLRGKWDEYHKKYDALVWIDADALMLGYPDFLFGIESDHAWRTRGGMPMGGTLFFALNKNTRRLLDAWVDHSRVLAHTKIPGQRALRAADKEVALSHTELPIDYCNFWHPGEDMSGLVIGHFRA